MRIVTAAEMRALDKRTIEELGLPGIVLMEHAGRTVARTVEEQLEAAHVHEGTVLVCAYKGNNGGDGFVAARLLANSGLEVEIALFCNPSELSGDALANYQVLGAFPVEVTIYNDADEGWQEEFAYQARRAAIIVDALLGTGIHGAVRPPLDEVIHIINDRGMDHGVRVVAVDLPSGLDADAGTYQNACVQADVTVTMALPKLGLVTFPGRELAGDVVVADISTPQSFVDELTPVRELLDHERVAFVLPPRPTDAHKGTFGRAFLLAGSPGFTGAAALSGLAALKTGAGLVTVGTPEPVHSILEEKLTEVMTLPLAADASGKFRPAALDGARTMLRQADALAIGPGIGRSGGISEFVRSVLEEAAGAGVPVVVDADGLNALADLGEAPEGLRAVASSGARVVLTPHPGELGRLLGQSVREVQADRMGKAIEAAQLSGAVTVLKGAGTVVADHSGNVVINPTGNPGMASGGTGDVLTGIIVGLLAQGMEPFEAACAGVFVHGLAADIAVLDVGERSLVASDITSHLSSAWKQLDT